MVWVLQLLLIRRGMETVRRFVDFAGPAIWIAMFVLAIWIAVKAGSEPVASTFSDKKLSAGPQVREFLAVVSLTVSYFVDSLLNFCDFSRFAPDQEGPCAWATCSACRSTSSPSPRCPWR